MSAIGYQWLAKAHDIVTPVAVHIGNDAIMAVHAPAAVVIGIILDPAHLGAIAFAARGGDIDAVIAEGREIRL